MLYFCVVYVLFCIVMILCCTQRPKQGELSVFLSSERQIFTFEKTEINVLSIFF